MTDERAAAKKWSTLSLLWGIMVISHIIRVALGVVAPTLMKLYDISPQAMGMILSGWNWAYTATLLFAGPTVDKFGPWVVMGIGSGIWGLATLALPIATTAAGLFFMRAVFGFGHSMLVPSVASSVSRWFKHDQRATAVGIAFSGNQVGLAVGATLVAFILAAQGWEAVFYWIGAGSLVLSVFWLLFYPDKRIGRQVVVRPGQEAETVGGVRWASLLHYRSTWGIAFGQMGYLYAYFFFMSWLPGYLVLERKMTVLRTGIVASLPFWAGMLGTLGGGWLGDYLIRKGVSRTVSRKSIIGTGLTLSTICVVTAAFVPQTWLAVTLLTFCMAFLRLATASGNSTPIDLAPPTAVASLTSIQNFSGNVGGLLAPIITGYIVGTTGSFVGALVVAGGMALMGAISYVFIVGPLETLPIPSGKTPGGASEPAR